MAASSIQIYNGSIATVAAPGASLAASASANCAWQTGVFDFVTTRAASWFAELAVNLSSSPTAGQTVDVYVGYNTATTGSLWPAGIGTGAASGYYTAYATGTGIAQGVAQLEWIGSVVLAATSGVQTALLGVFTPKLEYGVFVINNNSGVQIFATGNTLSLIPII